ncbi:segregation/condensation protein A [Spirochaetota bacterium]
MEDTSDYKPEKTGRNFQINDFDGPLDLLLFLIKKNEVNIYDIPLSSITEQFLNWLNEAEQADLDDMTEFYSLAATLLYIKSRMLLPVDMDLSDEIEDPRKDLVDKLIEYQKFKRLSEIMEKKESDAEWSIERIKMQRALPFSDEELWDKIDVWDLLKSFSGLIGSMSSEHIIDMYEEISISEKTALIHEYLEDKASFSFMDLITRPGSSMDIVCAFLAVLDAVKFRLVVIHQHRLFGDIQIRRYLSRSKDGIES